MTSNTELIKSLYFFLRINVLFFFIIDIFTDSPGLAAPNPTGIISTASSSEVISSQGKVLRTFREKDSWSGMS